MTKAFIFDGQSPAPRLSGSVYSTGQVSSRYNVFQACPAVEDVSTQVNVDLARIQNQSISWAIFISFFENLFDVNVVSMSTETQPSEAPTDPHPTPWAKLWKLVTQLLVAVILCPLSVHTVQ